MNLSELSGQLYIRVRWRDGIIKHVGITSTRPKQVASLFEGKPVTEALRLIPLLYSLCSSAQKVAALRAIESALEVEVSPIVDDARKLLIQAETTRELGIRLFTDWYSDETGVKTRLMQWFSRVQSECSPALQIEGEPDFLPDIGLLTGELEAILKPALSDLNAYYMLDSRPAQKMIDRLPECRREIFSAEFKGLDCYEIGSLDAADADYQKEIERLLSGDGADLFCSAPELFGERLENSLFSQRFYPNSRTMHAEGYEFGPLLLRLYSMVQSIVAMPGIIKAGSSNSFLQTDCKGTGIVNAARGVLIHRIELEGESLSDSIVKSYKIVAPTEWNFHPQGLLVKMLEGTKVTEEQLPLLVDSLVKLIDPCVTWSLELDTNDA